MDASGAKDNANPVIHSVATAANQRRADATQGLSDGQDWWRDSALLSQTASGSGTGQAKGSDVPYLYQLGGTGGNTLLEDDELFASAEASGPSSAAASLVEGKTAHGSPTGAKESTQETEEIDQQEIFDLVRSISDPEHPLTLEQLAVVNPQHITLTPAGTSSTSNSSSSYPHILLEFTPTIPHCSMSTLIGLSLRVRLMRALPARYKVDIRVRPGTHQSEASVNKQLNDKERVAAALENHHLLEVVMQALSTAYQRGGKAVPDRSDSVQVGADVDAALEQAELLAARLGVTV